MIASPSRAALLTTGVLGLLLFGAWPLSAQTTAEVPTFKVVPSGTGALSLEVVIPSKLKLSEESWRLEKETEILAVGTVAEATGTEVPAQVSFPLDGKFAGQKLVGVKLLGADKPIDLPQLEIPALEVQPGSEGRRTQSGTSSVTDKSGKVRSRLYPILVAALAIALLVVAAFALRTKWKFWQTEEDPGSPKSFPIQQAGNNEQPPPNLTRPEILKEMQGSLTKIKEDLATLLSKSTSPPAADSPPSVLDPPLQASSTGGVIGLQALASTAEQFWTTQRSLTQLAEIAKERGLQLFRWPDFQTCFEGSGIRTDHIQFQPWKPGAQGLVFLGWRESLNRPLSLYPASLSSFSSLEGKSILQALFEFRPPLTGSTLLNALRPVQPAQLGVAGDHYKLDKPGLIETRSTTAPGGQTDDSPHAPYPTNQPQNASYSPFESALDRISGIATSLTALQDKLSRLSDPRTDSALEPRIRSIESQVGEILRLVKASPVVEPPTSAPTATEMEAPMDSLRVPLASAPTLTTVTPAEAASRVRTLERLLAQPVLAASSEGEYLLALKALREIARIDVPRLPSGQFFRLAMNHAESASAIPIELIDDPGMDFPRLQKPEGTFMTLEQAWQVFLGFELDYPRWALVFPWSRLQKGAPTLARDLVDSTRSPSPLPEIVRCVEPLVLERRPNENAFGVVRKMVVAPIDATLLRGSS
jgi:hypothetical protein